MRRTGKQFQGAIFGWHLYSAFLQVNIFVLLHLPGKNAEAAVGCIAACEIFSESKWVIERVGSKPGHVRKCAQTGYRSGTCWRVMESKTMRAERPVRNLLSFFRIALSAGADLFVPVRPMAISSEDHQQQACSAKDI